MRDVTDVLTDAAPRPATDVDPDEIWAGARQRRRRRHLAMAAVGFVGLLAGGLGVVQLLTEPHTPTPIVGDTSPSAAPTPPDSEDPEPAIAFDGPTVVLEGWRTVEAFGVALSLPPNWSVEELREPGLLCEVTGRPETVYIEKVESGSSCEVAGEGPFLVLQRWPEGGSPELPGYERGTIELSGGEASRSWDLASPEQLIEKTRIRWTGDDVVATSYGARDVTVDALQPLDHVVEGLRRSDATDCPDADCTTPASESPHGVTVQPEQLHVPFRMVNRTTDPLQGGVVWYVERWDGTGWVEHDPAYAWPAPLISVAPGATSDEFRARLPARPGYYRVVKPMTGTTLYSEVIRVVLPADAPATGGDAVSDLAAGVTWTTTAGEPVPESVVTSFAGSEHCGWGSLTYLQVGDAYYLGDPQGILAREVDVAYERQSALPESATDTGYRGNGWQLWIADDPAAAYVVKGGTTERWPLRIRSEQFCD